MTSSKLSMDALEKRCSSAAIYEALLSNKMNPFSIRGTCCWSVPVIVGISETCGTTLDKSAVVRGLDLLQVLARCAPKFDQAGSSNSSPAAWIAVLESLAKCMLCDEHSTRQAYINGLVKTYDRAVRTTYTQHIQAMMQLEASILKEFSEHRSRLVAEYSQSSYSDSNGSDPSDDSEVDAAQQAFEDLNDRKKQSEARFHARPGPFAAESRGHKRQRDDEPYSRNTKRGFRGSSARGGSGQQGHQTSGAGRGETDAGTAAPSDEEVAQFADSLAMYKTAWAAGIPDIGHDRLITNRLSYPVLDRSPRSVNEAGVGRFYGAACKLLGDEGLSFLVQERLKWHPDKIDHMFSRAADKGALKDIAVVIFRVLMMMINRLRTAA